MVRNLKKNTKIHVGKKVLELLTEYPYEIKVHKGEMQLEIDVMPLSCLPQV